MTSTVDLEKRLESHAFYLERIVSDDIAADVRQALTQLREYRTALEARPAMPEAVAEAIDLLEHYADFIRTVKADDLERHPYLPQLEQVAADLRALSPTTGDVREAAPERKLCPHCNGCGWQNPAQAVDKCETCGGSGVVPAPASPPSAHDMREALEKISAMCPVTCDMTVAHEMAAIADEALASLDAVKAAVEAEWQDISTAPKDQEVDLWAFSQDAGRGYRVPDCKWIKDSWHSRGDKKWERLSDFALTPRQWRPIPVPPAIRARAGGAE